MEDESRAESPVLEKKRTLTNHCSPFHIILSIIVVLVAIGGSYLLTMSEEVLEAEEEVFEEEVIIEETASAFDDFYFSYELMKYTLFFILLQKLHEIELTTI